MTSRDVFLQSIRSSLGVNGPDATRASVVSARLNAPPRGVVPARGQGDAAAVVETFKAEAKRAQATVIEVAAMQDVPKETARYLRDNNLPATLKIGADPRLAGMLWSVTSLEVTSGPSDGSDPNGMNCAFGAVAKTGTLALTSGPENPSTLNFLPDNALVVVFAQDIASDFETVFTRLRQKFGAGLMPRTLNFVTGPSRSADIEQTLLLGAHGPRKLHIIIVRNAPTTE